MTSVIAPDKYDPQSLQGLGRLDLIAAVIAEGIQAGLNKSRKYGFSTEFSDFKSYDKGDDLRMIDWRLYARTDKIYIRRYEAETEVEVMFLLDSSASMAWRYKNNITKLEYSANLLSGLAMLHMKQQNKAGLMTCDETESHYLQPRCSRNRLEEIYAILASVVPGKSSNLSKLAADLKSQKKQRGIVAVFSDLEEEEEELAKVFQELGAHDDEVVIYHILDDAEVTLPFETATWLKDSETGELVRVNIKEIKKEHSEKVEAFRSRRKELCSNNGLLYVPLETSHNYVDVIMKQVELAQAGA